MELNKPPVLVAMANQTVSEGATLSFTVAATDPDLPANIMTYSLVSGPTGASVNASSGVFSWTPSEAQGPSTNNFTVRVTDNGSSPLSDTKSFIVVVTEVNKPPVLAAIANWTINQGATLSFTVAAADA